MRRESDIVDGERTGVGRRARDRLLAGETQDLPDTVPADSRPEIRNLMLFVSDELREAALALGGIEAFLVDTQRFLDGEDGPPTAGALEDLLGRHEMDDRIQVLDDAVTQLRRSMHQLYARLSK